MTSPILSGDLSRMENSTIISNNGKGRAGMWRSQSSAAESVLPPRITEDRFSGPRFETQEMILAASNQEKAFASALLQFFGRRLAIGSGSGNAFFCYESV